MKVFSVALAIFVASASAAPGVRFGFPDGRIAGGHDANPHQFPYQVSLQLILADGPRHNCGGSILNENYILTAAHCLYDIRIQIVAGIHDLSANEASEQRRGTAGIFVHPGYPGGDVVAPHDVAVIRVDQPFVFNEFVQPIALPPRDAIHSGVATLSGWGSTSTSWLPTFPNILQTVNMPLIEYNDCERLISHTLIHPTNICTGPLTEGVSTCPRDAGSPLVIGGANPVQIGIVSWGFYPCGTVNLPSVYGRVSAYIDFINDIISN